MKPFTTIAVVVFAVMAIVHLCRLFTGWQVVVAGFVVPVWWSALGLVVAGGLALTVWREEASMTASAPGPTNSHGIVSLASSYPFAETVRRLLSAFADHGIKVFAAIDQQAEASAVGLSMPPATMIIFGSPKAGTPLMLARPESGVDLPLKVLVSESVPGQVAVIFNSATYIIDRHSLPAALASNLVPAERLIANALQP